MTPMEGVRNTLKTLGFSVSRLEPLAGDASSRRFFRAFDESGDSLVATLYPENAGSQAERDYGVQTWGWERGLPIPRPWGWRDLVTVSDDLGDDDLDRVLRRGASDLQRLILDNLAAFQDCDFQGAPTPAFDAIFFRRELAVFEEYARVAEHPFAHEIAGFCDDLAQRIAAHPYCLVHRDYHVNNLFLHKGTVWAVDFQDMRGGPDTYDLASLLRERGGTVWGWEEQAWLAQAGRRLAWPAGWEKRYLECAAQRGLKVVGTFLRLASLGRTSYLAWLGPVLRNTIDAVAAIGATKVVVDLLQSIDRR